MAERYPKAMKRIPDEVITFLNQHRESDIKFCDVKVVRFDLERQHVISQGQRQQLDKALSVADTNDLFYQFLHNDPSPETLEAAAKVLMEAPNTTNMNRRFAKVIEDFLSLNATSSEDTLPDQWLRGDKGTGEEPRTVQTVECLLRTYVKVIGSSPVLALFWLGSVLFFYSSLVDLSTEDTLPDSVVQMRENAYSEYERFTFGPTDMQYVKLAILKNEPSAKSTTGDQSAVLDHFRDWGQKSKVDCFIKPEELLKKSADKTRVVFGQAGMGKTTALKYTTQQVAISKCESDFKVILYFPLRDGTVGSATDLKGLLSYYGSGCNIASVEKWLLERRGKDVLLVFDGADEAKDLLSENSQSVLLQLLKARLLPEASIILSSRPGVCPDLQDHCSTFYEIQGFDSEAIKVYVESFFKADPPKFKEMMRALEERPDLMPGAYVPMNLFIFCSIYKHGQSFPPTMTSCYQTYACQILRRELLKENRKCHLNPDLSGLPDDLSTLLSGLGLLAFEGLNADPPSFIFSECTIRRIFPSLGNGEISDSFFKGLLQVHAGKVGFCSEYTFSFSHATLQEFLAAFHLQLLPEKKQIEFWKMNLENASFAIVLRFFAGLTSLSSNGLVEQLVRPYSVEPQKGILSTNQSVFSTPTASLSIPAVCDYSNPHLLFLFHALYESQNRQLTRDIVKHLNKIIKFSISVSPFDEMVISFCLSQCNHLTQLGFFNIMLFAYYPLKHWKSIRSANPNLPFPSRFSVDHWSEEEAKSVSASLNSLEKFDIEITSSTCVSALSMLFSINSLRGLDLNMGGCTITDSDYSHLKKVLLDNHSLEELSVDGELPTALYEALQVSSITRLEVRNANGHEYASVANLTQLRHLQLWHTDPLPVLNSLCHRRDVLEDLVIWTFKDKRDLTEEECAALTAALSKAKIRSVVIWWKLSTSGWIALSKGLSLNKEVRKVTLWEVPEELHEEMRKIIESNPGIILLGI